MRGYVQYRFRIIAVWAACSKRLEVFPVMKLPCNFHLLGHPLRQYSDREISAEKSEDKKTK